MKKCLALILISLFAAPAFAQTQPGRGEAVLEWSHPTLNVDGTPINATGPGAIKGYRIEYGICPAVGISLFVPYPLTEAVIGPFAGSTTACFQVRTQNNYGLESDPTGVVTKTFPEEVPPAPTAPLNLSVR